MIRRRDMQVGKEEQVRISRWVYLPAILSFVPLLGLFFGVITLLWTMCVKGHGRGRAAFLAVLGMLVTLLLFLLPYVWPTLFYPEPDCACGMGY